MEKMVKLIVKQPGFFVTLPKLGSFRSPFKVTIPESLRPLIEAELLKNGVKNFKILEGDLPKEKKQIKKNPKEEQIVNVNMTEVLERLKDIQTLVSKVLNRDPLVREVIIQRGEFGREINTQSEIEEEIFIPRLPEKISVIDLSVKTVERENIDSQV